ncbi:MAG TPA: hypothetical protein VEU62_06450, partial [Bryobacterales bacterium]|nr:hypothetical protein [Bryobacterales bacterium]
GIQWATPSGWKPEGSRPMRAATYAIPAARGDKEAGECGVYYFGPGQGGGVAANVTRWVGQFEQPGGKSSAEAAQVRKRTIGGVTVTTIDVSGTYLFSPTPMSPDKIPKPDYRLLGAIVEAPQGLVFFKFTGPAKTVAANAGAFQEMLRSLRK